MTDTLRLSPRAPLCYALTRDGSDVGWLRSGLVGFHGFSDRASALRSGAVAAAVLRDWYAVRWHSTPREWPGRVPLPDQVVVDGGVVGRLVHPRAAPFGGAESYGFELALPPETWLALMLQLAQRMHLALVAEGLVAPSGGAAEAVGA